MDYRRSSIGIPIKVIEVCPNVPNISGDVLVAPNSAACVILATVISMDFLVSMSSW